MELCDKGISLITENISFSYIEKYCVLKGAYFYLIENFTTLAKVSTFEKYVPYFVFLPLAVCKAFVFSTSCKTATDMPLSLIII